MSDERERQPGVIEADEFDESGKFIDEAIETIDMTSCPTVRPWPA